MPTTIAQYTSPIEEHIAKGRLESSGIPVYVADEHYIGANWMISTAIGGVKLQVPEAFAAWASRIAQRLNAGDYEDADLAFVNACPYCQSEDIHRLAGSWRLAFIVLFLVNFPFPYSHHNYQCRTCSRNGWKRPSGLTQYQFNLLQVRLMCCFHKYGEPEGAHPENANTPSACCEVVIKFRLFGRISFSV